jgi:hypothetical protein
MAVKQITYSVSNAGGPVTSNDLGNVSNVKGAAVEGLIAIDEKYGVEEEIIETLSDDLGADVDNAVDDPDTTEGFSEEEKMQQIDRYASPVFKLAGKASKNKKMTKAKRKKMHDKLRDRFFAKSRKAMSCTCAASMGGIINDVGPDAPPLDPDNPNEQSILEYMDNCTTDGSISDPAISLTCPGARIVMGTEINLAPVITNSLGDIVISGGEVVGDVSSIVVLVDFGDGTVSSNLMFSHIYPEPIDTATITIAVVDSSTNLSSTATCEFAVYDPAHVTIGPPDPPVIKAGELITIPIITDKPIYLVPPGVVMDPPGGSIIIPVDGLPVIITLVDYPY